MKVTAHSLEMELKELKEGIKFPLFWDGSANGFAGEVIPL
jgi:hypothetical protein